jgi:hypothetical protein
MSTIMLIVVLLIAVIDIGLVIFFVMRGAPRQVYSTRHPVTGWLFAIIGDLGLLVASGTWLYTLHFTRAALHTNGTVIAMREATGSGSGPRTFAPTFRFRDAAGIEHVVTSNVYQRRGAFQVGDTVAVLYLRDSPQAARLDSFWQVWGMSTVLGMIGCMALTIGFAMVFWPKVVG